jgi:hypothetical protein
MSILDHIYVQNPVAVITTSSTRALFGDQLMVAVTINLDSPTIEAATKRDWRRYNRDLL